MSRGKVLIAAPVHAVLLEGLEAEGYEFNVNERITQGEAAALLQDCVGVITSTRLLLDRGLIDAAPQLQWIGRMGSGMEIIDVAYARQRGIACYSSPEGNCNAVAEHALGLLLSLTKRITSSYEEVKQGLWLRDANRGIELEGKTIGIIGFGHTGRAFARKLSGFDMRILAYDTDPEVSLPAGVEKATLEQIQEQAAVISFHVPYTKSTRHYFNVDFLGKMNQSFILINTSRGDVIDTKAVISGLKQDKILAAALDVIEEEPLAAMSKLQRKNVEELLQNPRFLITPHIAGYSVEAVFKMSRTLLEKIRHGVVKPL